MDAVRCLCFKIHTNDRIEGETWQGELERCAHAPTELHVKMSVFVSIIRTVAMEKVTGTRDPKGRLTSVVWNWLQPDKIWRNKAALNMSSTLPSREKTVGM